MVTEQMFLFLVLLLGYGIDGSPYVFLKINDSCLSWTITRNIICDSETSLHCILNENYVQGIVCAGKRLILKGFCPFYRTDNQIIDVRACNESHGECPDSDFLSYTSSQYSGCYSKQSTLKSMKSTTKPMTQTSYTSTVQTTQRTISTTSYEHDLRQDDCTIIYTSFVGTVVILGGLLILSLITRKKNCSKGCCTPCHNCCLQKEAVSENCSSSLSLMNNKHNTKDK